MRRFIAILLIVASLMACNNTANKEETDIKAFDVNYIDPSVDPCEDFYNYAIGNWRKDNPIPETESRWMAFNILYEENRQKLMKIIDELVSSEEFSQGSEEQMIRDLYLAGMDSVQRDQAGLEPIKPFLQSIESAQSHADILQLFGQLRSIGISNPIGISIGADKIDSRINAVYASQSGLNLPDRDYYLSDKKKFVDIRTAYVKHINEMFAISGLSEEAGSRILELETELAQISWNREDRRDPVLTHNRMALTDWSEQLDQLDVLHILKERGFGSFDSLIVSHPSYFTALNSWFKERSVSDWKLYMKWNTIGSFASHLSSKMEQKRFEFYSGTLKGVEKMKPRNERVFNVVNRLLGEPLGKLYVKENFSEEGKAYVIEMIENLRLAYKESIEALDWMSDETKEKAKKKLSSFTYKVAYPDKWKDYSALNIAPQDYAVNIIQIRTFEYNRMLDKLGQKVDRSEWHMTPQMVNAYYSSSNNEIVFPAGILQPPFFHKDFDYAINYGGIGAVIGHEFSHGFDDKGSMYDWNGNLKNWWSKEDREKFEALAAKLGAQYNEYSPVDSMYVNGKMTMGENIADLGGVTLAYDALLKQYDNNFPDDIDGFSWQQRFFLGWANIWKGNITDEDLIYRLKSDNHSPAQFRVLGPLVNLKPYEEAFGACENKAMHKPDSLKIKIW
ncbi:MAG: M13 family metallopeptidase [Bacteroidia bacterium]